MVLLVPKIYAVTALGFDTIMLTTALLFRKPKHKKEKQQLDHRFIGWYLVISSAVALIVSHFVSYASLVDYYMGLGIDGAIFYMGLRCLYV
ncbi:unknown [Sulfolobus spindle-shaped virus 6]|uniref:Uncharacterized protein n=1 Tax=Sulfolobus spindle-shaped virus 6 TaxID=693627 RepID=D1GF22_9VIRU|nr:hypothetical protein SSSV6_gp04 [Sulfolobus spindle-shaped virus 6]ACZ35724.1 unknown [Sulfolobus spindle-shaped virus 6]